MIRTARETGVDMVGASDLKLFYDRALRQGRALPFAVAIGTHPALMIAAAHMAPSGVDESSWPAARRRAHRARQTRDR